MKTELKKYNLVIPKERVVIEKIKPKLLFKNKKERDNYVKISHPTYKKA